MSLEPNYSAEAEAISRRTILIEAGLFIEDPEADSSLTFPVPEGVKVKELLTSYDTKSTIARKVRCAGCRTMTPHYRGFRVVLDNGGRANIGIDCGESISHPGAWDEMSTGLKRRQDKAFYDARVGPAVAQIEKIEELRSAWLANIYRLDRFHASLPSELTCEFTSIAKSGGVMQLEKRRKLSKEETRRRSGQKTEPYIKFYGTVPSPDYFRPLHPWPDKAMRAFQKLPEVKLAIAHANGLAQLVKAFAELRELRKRFEEVHDDHQAALRNLKIDWWDAACRWANSEDDQFSLTGRTVHFVPYDSDREEQAIPIPEPEDVGGSLWPEIKAIWPR